MQDLHTHTQPPGLSLNSWKSPEASRCPLALPRITRQPFSRLICIMHFAYTPKLGQVCPIRIGAFQTGVVRRRCGPFTTFVAPRLNIQLYLLTFLTPSHSTCSSTADNLFSTQEVILHIHFIKSSHFHMF